MLRFFFGLTLAQLVIAVLVYFGPLSNPLELALLIGFVILLISIVTTLWFNTVAKLLADKRIAVLKEQFANEREKINVSAERAQKKLLKSTQKEIESERRRQSTRANLKIGGTIALAAGFGVVMLMSQFFTLGLLSLTTAGGAIGGYLARTRREQLDSPDYKMIEGVEVVDEQPKTLTDQSTADATDTSEAIDEKSVVSIDPESNELIETNNPTGKS